MVVRIKRMWGLVDLNLFIEFYGTQEDSFGI